MSTWSFEELVEAAHLIYGATLMAEAFVAHVRRG